MSTESLKLGTKPRWGETVCGFGVDRPDCDKPAVWHVMWLDSGSVSATCEEHLAYIDSRPHPEYERHSFAPTCGNMYRPELFPLVPLTSSL